MATLTDLFRPDGTEKSPMRPSVLKTLQVPFDSGSKAGGQGDSTARQCGGNTVPHSAGVPSLQSNDFPDCQPPTLEVDLDLAAVLHRHPFAFLSGQAGTGKTFLAREFARQRSDVILCCTTGIAAVNMGDATTINALLGYFDTNSLMHAFASGFLTTRLRHLRKSGIRILVLDEASMLSADQLTVLCEALDDLNLKKEYDASIEEVTYQDAGDLTMKLLLVGDFAQLPPVDADFAFQSPAWSRFVDHTFKLNHIHRQDQRSFITALQAIRRGEGKTAVDIIQPRFAQTIDFAFPGTTIVGKNDEVDRINLLRHAQLPGELLSWKTVRSGEQQKDWLRLIPESVDLKVGALVMVLANRSLGWDPESKLPIGYAYVNGDLGEVVGKDEEGIVVRLQRTGTDTTVHALTSEWKEPTGKKNPAYEIKGAVTRMPLRLAYATTVHKSQGLSLDQVQVNLTSWMFKKGGMVYVALSRCRSLEGLRIVGNPRMFLSRCTVDPRVTAWL